MAAKRSIYVVGSSNTDMVIKASKLPAPGETVMGGDFLMNPGGKGANQAVTAARLGGESVTDEEKEIIEIAMSNVYFDESSQNALRILRAITGNVYRSDQEVVSGSMHATKLARQLEMSKSALLVLARSLNIAPEIFPRHHGSDIPYFLPDQIERIRLAHNQLFGN